VAALRGFLAAQPASWSRVGEGVRRFTSLTHLVRRIPRTARTLQGRELNINFFIQLLYHLLIPWMRVPRFLENAETRYFIPKLSCQRRLNGEAKAIGDDAWLSRPSGLPWVRVGHRRRRHFDLNRGRCFGVI